MRETIGSGANAQVLDFIYDASGRPFALKYTNGAADPVTYYYVLNLQGDVVGLTDVDGVHIVKYSYNAWGAIIAVTDADDVAITDVNNIAHINPLRYRGYYYDVETGFYYLQSRYYDPTMHRFINADSLASTGQGVTGTNMFAYCNSNPVANQDPDGRFAVPAEPGCAIELLLIWLKGDGSYRSFEDSSSVSTAFKGSEYMNSILEQCIEEYKTNGKSNFTGSGRITGYAEFDLWMGVRTFDYEVTVRSETKVYKSLFYEETYVVYYCDVRITDIYNFNTNTDSGDGLGSYLNNFAYNMQQKGYGTDYAWEANYTKSFGDRNDIHDFIKCSFGLFI